MEQAPVEQMAVPWAVPQAAVQAPQWLVLVLRFASHPSGCDRLQSPQPVTQEYPHLLLAQVAVAWAGVGQAFAQAPQ